MRQRVRVIKKERKRERKKGEWERNTCCRHILIMMMMLKMMIIIVIIDWFLGLLPIWDYFSSNHDPGLMFCLFVCFPSFTFVFVYLYPNPGQPIHYACTVIRNAIKVFAFPNILPFQARCLAFLYNQYNFMYSLFIAFLISRMSAIWPSIDSIIETINMYIRGWIEMHNMFQTVTWVRQVDLGNCY